MVIAVFVMFLAVACIVQAARGGGPLIRRGPSAVDLELVGA